MFTRYIKLLSVSLLLVSTAMAATALPETNAIDDKVNAHMQEENVPGIALAVIENGKVVYKKAYGFRETETETALDADTVMYGASITKFVFSTFVMQLVHEGKLDLDTSIAKLLPNPLPTYERFSDLEGDERWRKLTLRSLLGHTTGFPNFRFFTPDGGFDPDAKLEFFYEPGERYGYSGEGYYIAQLVVEEALGIKTGSELQRRFFDPLGMTRTSLVWRDDFRPNFAQGYAVDGENLGHNMQSNVRAAGSMDTTLNDLSAWVAALMRGKILSNAAFDELLKPVINITSPSQFPTLDNTIDPRNVQLRLSAGLGAETWYGPQGLGFAKGGHNEKTDNMLVCLIEAKKCVVLLSNTAKGDRVFPQIVEFIMGPTGLPWRWKYSSLNK
ncbi:serine hydrolase domain-containing protein [Kordiimonas aquimaris]|uniref:serine hydrolase domain-containing protein n=1 Tax=Kordiimonas aquimaris TaxID=707591 RepID=UPI0021D22C30|nr:serine hydrolase domain-containing protein [Kordiimonas aquimaris]